MTEENAKNEKKPTTNDVEDAAEARGGERWKHDRKQYRFCGVRRAIGTEIVETDGILFSDSNLPRDKFLRETVERDPESRVDLRLVLKFQRMRDMLHNSGGSNHPEVIEAVAKLLKEKFGEFASLRRDEFGSKSEKERRFTTERRN